MRNNAHGHQGPLLSVVMNGRQGLHGGAASLACGCGLARLMHGRQCRSVLSEAAPHSVKNLFEFHCPHQVLNISMRFPQRTPLKERAKSGGN
jgi:hypothetical protein